MLSSFRARVALIFGLLVATLSVAISLLLGQSIAGTVLHEESDTLATLGRNTAITLADGLAERMREVELLAATPPAGDPAGPDRAAWQRTLDNMQRSRPQYSWIGVAAPGGQVLVATGSLLVGQDVAGRPWFKAGQQGLFTGDVHQALLLAKLLGPSASGEPLRFIDFAAPLKNAQGQLQGVLGVHATWDWGRSVAESLESPAQRSKGVELIITDKSGQVIHQPREPGSDVKLDLARQLPNGSAVDMAWPDGEHYLTVATPVPARSAATDLGWTVIVREPMQAATASAAQARRTALAVGALAALLAIAVAWWAAGRVALPLSQVAQIAKRIEQGELTLHIPALGPTRELHALSTALEGMKQSLQQRGDALARANAELEARVAARTQDLELANQELTRLASHDALTGLCNRRAADERIAYELARHRRSGAPLALLLIDVDHFKRINDQHGHDAGDRVLETVAGRLAQHCRASDFVARYGGEEFLLLLPDTDAAGAEVAANKLRLALAEPLPPTLAAVGRLTASIGVAAPAQDFGDAAGVFKAADQALYAAKGGGRNRVVLATKHALAEA
ncbi:diguanylate cyclase [Ideonella sp.]|uniref:sensor domain-containing diguanylate cyclase n=1 Tax=Ideonella sp. TaxID=1929293 RepID=UPI0035B4AEF0